MKLFRQILISTVSFILLGVMLASCTAGKKPETTETPGTTEAPGTEAVVTTTAKTEDKTPVADTKWVSAIFSGGPVNYTGTLGTTVHEDLKNSGFNTLIIWSVHIHDDGSLWLNDKLAAKDGEFCLARRSKKDKFAWEDIKGEGSSITRIELSIGAWGCNDFEAIRDIMNRDGDGEDTILYKNFKALIDATKADAINYDDESCYDAASMIRFGKMCVKMGCKVTLCPYTNISVWKQVKVGLRNNCDRIYVQCYDGGAGNVNNLGSWANEFGMPVIPGYWCLHNGTAGDAASSVKTKLKSAGESATGAFMWLYDDMRLLTGSNDTASYAKAINSCNPER